MLICHHTRPHQRDLRVDVADPDATVADLAEALHPDRPIGPLLIDGRLVAAATPLDRAGIPDGAIVAHPDEPPPADAWRAPWRLTVTSGFDAGRAVALDIGTHVIGRAPDAVAIHDQTVSSHHARITLGPNGQGEIEDLGSTNGTWILGRRITAPHAFAAGTEVRCGAARWVIERGDPAVPTAPAPSGGGGSRPFHRPPRPWPPRDRSPIALPPEPPAPGPVSPVGAGAVLGSLAVGGVMVAVLHSWTYALFALLGPVLLVANAIDGRRRRRKDRRRSRRRRHTDLTSFRAALSSRRDADLAAAEIHLAGPARAARVVGAGDLTCWERRADHPDAFTVRVGVGPVPWRPPLAEPSSESSATDVRAIVDELTTVSDGPAGLPLDPAAPVAIVGARSAALALARSVLVQAAVAHGPADLQVAALCAPERASEWGWCAWLPHAHDPAIGSLLVATPAAATVLTGPRPTALEGPAGTPGVRPRRLVVVDDPRGLADRRGPVRTLLRSSADPTSDLVPIVLVDDADDVPAICRVVLTVSDDGVLTAPPSIASGPVALVGTHLDVATDVARRLARLDDPEVDDPGRGLPDTVSLASLLGAERITPSGIGARWRAGGPDPAPRAAIGATADGPFEIDLATDGPHVLIAGTTGAGKSELLRTLVASLAVNSSPDHLTFVLIDFKGGSAFDACAELPHTTGLVTDLDEHLAARALQCLEAELRYREERLRHAGAGSLPELRKLDRGGPPLPRLVVVVDEFATLAAELPDFVDALVGVAQRGRSLGVHLVLATQRPSGSVSEHIRANTALRIALRVQADVDSSDVIDSPAAADLPRLLPGRALVRLGPGELVALQTALSTTSGRPTQAEPVQVRRLQIDTGDAGEAGLDQRASGAAGQAPTDLARLVDAAAAAWAAWGGARPRRAWPDPLPPEVGWPLADGPDESATSAGGSDEHRLVIGLADDPAHQRHTAFAWQLSDGPLLAVGLPGSGTTTLAATVALTAARTWSPAGCHIHVIDMGAGALLPLAGLPHVGAVIGPDEHERQRRLYAELSRELAGRRRVDGNPMKAPMPIRLVILDGLGAFRSRWTDLDPSGTWDRFLEVTAQGASVGIHTVIAAEGTSSAPHQVVSACRQRLVFRLGERADHGAFGIPASAVPALVPGRAVAAEGPTEVHVARPSDGLAAAVARLAGSRPTACTPTSARQALPGSVGTLPSSVSWTSLDSSPGPSIGERGTLDLVVGLSDIGLVPARLRLPPGGHALIAGPPRSGRTSTLRILAIAASARDVAVAVVTRNPSEWPGATAEVFDPSDERLASLVKRVGPLLVLVDDADLTADDHAAIGSLATERCPERHVIAAARADRLRSLYGHWTRELRADRTGLLLVPDPDLDGDLLGARLPRTPSVAMGPGRGWLTGGLPEGFVQVALAR